MTGANRSDSRNADLSSEMSSNTEQKNKSLKQQSVSQGTRTPSTNSTEVSGTTKTNNTPAPDLEIAENNARVREARRKRKQKNGKPLTKEQQIAQMKQRLKERGDKQDHVINLATKAGSRARLRKTVRNIAAQRKAAQVAAQRKRNGLA